MGTPGIMADVEPPAIIHWPNVIVTSFVSVWTFNSVLDTNEASPWMVSTFLALAIWAMPLFNWETILFLWSRT